MVLDHGILTQCLEDLTEHVGGLLNDAGVGNGVDDPLLAMAHGVIQRKSQARQRFAATGGHREAEDTRRQIGLGSTLRQYLGADAVDRRFRLTKGSQIRAQLIHERAKIAFTLARLGLATVHVRLGIQKIRIHQRGKHHPDPQGEAPRIEFLVFIADAHAIEVDARQRGFENVVGLRARKGF